MACRLTTAIPPCPAQQSLPGIQRVWLARKSNAMDYRYTDDEFGIITWILTSSGNPTPFLEFACDSAYVTSDETLARSTKGKTFPQSIVLRFAKMDKDKRASLEGIINDRCVCVYLDSNSKYWLLGQDNGLQCLEYQGTSDIDGGGNNYNCKLQGLERFMQREVNGANFIYVSPNNGQQLVRNNIGGSGPNGGITPILNTWGEYESGVMVRPMPLSQMGNKPIEELLQ